MILVNQWWWHSGSSSVIYVPSISLSTITRSAAVYFSALALLFPAFGTRHTFYADRAAAFLKYLRFSRETDWNNFSHTDSSPAAFKRAQSKQKDGGDFSSACALFSFLCMPRGPFGNLRLRCRVPWVKQTFVTFDEFSWEFFFTRYRKCETLFFLFTFLPRRTNTSITLFYSRHCPEGEN